MAARMTMVMLTTAAMFTTITYAKAEIDLCQAVALSDVHAIESPEAIIERGDVHKAISQYNVVKKAGLGMLCEHGGYCYPAQVIEGGNKVATFRLTNCKICKPISDKVDEIGYRLILDRSTVAPAALKRMDLDDKLLQIGLCQACADYLTELYFRRPASRCARLVRRVLEGDPRAFKALGANPYCE
jgi:hypothetical protein